MPNLPGISNLTPAQRRLRASAAANARWSSPEARAAHSDRSLARYCAEVDPDGTLPEAERLALAKQRRRARMQHLALLSSKARAAKRAGAGDSDA
jgi:hypothetical protein